MKTHPARTALLLVAALLAWPAGPARASSQLALDKGCYSCHGEPPRRSAPTLAQLAADYARYRGQAGAPRQLADKLREGGLFGHIAAHERLSMEECETLMRWLIDGAK
jgi:cytochrome c